MKRSASLFLVTAFVCLFVFGAAVAQDSIVDTVPQAGLIAYVRPTEDTVTQLFSHGDLWLVEASGGTPVNITQGAFGVNTFAWAPDGTRIAFYSVIENEGGYYVYDLASGQISFLLADDGGDGVMAWSPDSATLAVTLGGWTQVVLLPLAGGSPGVLLDTVALGFEAEEIAELAWSPDGTQLAVRGYDRGTDNSVLYVADLDAAEIRQLNAPDPFLFEETFTHLDWMADSQRIFATANILDRATFPPSNRINPLLVDAAAGTREPIVQPEFGTDYILAPDKTQYAIASTHSIFVAAIGANEAVFVSQNHPFEAMQSIFGSHRVSFSPDSSQIVYSSYDPDGRTRLYIVGTTAGQAPVAIAEIEAPVQFDVISALDWQPAVPPQSAAPMIVFGPPDAAPGFEPPAEAPVIQSPVIPFVPNEVAAPTILTIAYGEVVTGTLEPGERLTFEFEGEIDDEVNITLTSDDFSPYLELGRHNGTIYASNANLDGGTTTGLQRELADFGGIIVVSAWGSQGSGDFELRLTLIGGPSVPTEQTIGYGETAAATLLPGDAFRFLFEGQVGEEVTIIASSSDFSPRLVLFSPDGNVIGLDESRGPEKQITQVLPVSGTYTFAVAETAVMPSGGDFQVRLTLNTGSTPESAALPTAAPTAAPTTVPPTDAPTPTVSSFTGPARFNPNGIIAMYELPDVRSRELPALYSTNFPILGVSLDGGFYQILNFGYYGWVRAIEGTVEGDFTSVPVLNDQGTPVPDPSSVAAATFNPNPTLVHASDGRIEQWASRAEASSEYSGSRWSADQATGAPNTNDCGDFDTAWASQTSTGIDTLTVYFDAAVIAETVNIYQTYNPGAIVSVALIPQDGGQPIDVRGSADPGTDCPGIFSLDVSLTDTGPVVGVSIHLDQTITGSWNEIDAVQLIGRSNIEGASAPVAVPTSTPTPVPGGVLYVGGQATVFTADEGLKLRDATSTSSNVLENMPPGVVVTLLEGPASANGYVWWRVLSPSGREGWSVESADGIETLIPVDVSGAIEGSPAVCAAITSPGDTNLRRGPGTNFEIGEVIPGDFPVSIVAQVLNQSGFTWYQLENTLWVRDDVVVLQEGCTDIPVVR